MTSKTNLLFALLGLYVLGVVFNIIEFHRTGFGSVNGEQNVIEKWMVTHVDDNVSEKRPSSSMSVSEGKGQFVVTSYETESKIDNATNDNNDDNEGSQSMSTEKGVTADTNVSTIGNDSNEGSQSLPTSYRHETNIFRKMLLRSSLDADVCSNLHPTHLGKPKEKTFDTGVPPLPENGIHEVLRQWLDSGDSNRGDYPMCELPPAKSCDISEYSVILMSHTVDDDKRLRKLNKGILDLASRKGTAEIILVWNSDKTVLIESDKTHAKEIVDWANDDSHPLRVFYSLENGLENNLLNRYHPMINPKHEAIIYFDDDGPFFAEEPMDVGFQLWKFNSDVQVGCMTRNIRFPSKRMNEAQKKTTELRAQHYRDDAWQSHIHPYDTEVVEKAMVERNLKEPGYPQFTPICRDETGDVVEYNYFVFPHYKAHMSLPSGSILHRNYLCFIWHPVFNQLRQFILDHPTHPDDMTISTLVSHLSGKPIRTFPRSIEKTERRNLRDVDTGENKSVFENYEGFHSKVENGEHRRKLLWQQDDWGNMREEAINSILGYFGSINPGSIGWCAGTEYEVKSNPKENLTFNCKPFYPERHMVPWINEGGIGFDECPKK